MSQNNNNEENQSVKSRSASLPALRKRSDPGRITLPFKNQVKPTYSRSPVLSKKTSLSPDGSLSSLSGQGTKIRFPSGGSGGMQSMEDMDGVNEQLMSPSIILTTEATPGSENGKSPELGTDIDVVDGLSSAELRSRRTTIDMYKAKVEKTTLLIKQEHNRKESNVNEYLRQAPSVDEQQRQKMKQSFEKQNQKLCQTINTLQKKLEMYQKKIKELEEPGSGHKGHRLREMGQGIKGVVGNIKGAKDAMVSKPREFAHLIKNKFGSADNIHSNLKLDDVDDDEYQRSLRLSDDDGSSVTSGSGFAPVADASPHSIAAGNVEILVEEIAKQREYIHKVNERLSKVTDRLQHLHDEVEGYKIENMQLKTTVEEERYRYGNLEDQLNDLTELHQHEITNLRQEITSATEKIEYQLDERIHDTQDVLENCSTRVTKMELQQQQQQIISIEGVDNVTFKTLLTKLLNVVIAVVAVILVFVSTIANVISPFLLSRMRILTTITMIVLAVFVWRYWDAIMGYVRSEYRLPYYIL